MSLSAASHPAAADTPPTPPATTRVIPAAGAVWAGPGGGTATHSAGQHLLAECIARMPEDPIIMAGTLTMRRIYGVEVKKLNYTVSLNWGASPPVAVYEIFTVDDTLIETVVATRADDGALTLKRSLGPDQTPADPPAINEPVQGTDITWLDITLDFVWWKNPEIVGEERIRGRTCDILEVEPAHPLEGCFLVRLWIDRDQKMVMQAAQLDARGRERRRMWVRAVRKVNQRWLLRDIEVETLGTGHRTRLHVATVTIIE